MGGACLDAVFALVAMELVFPTASTAGGLNKKALGWLGYRPETWQVPRNARSRFQTSSSTHKGQIYEGSRKVSSKGST